MVEVFKTNVRTKKQARKVASLLQPMKVNFDLEDCDKILRVEDEQINAEAVVKFVTAQGFDCTVLDD